MYTYQWEQFLILDIEIICSIKNWLFVQYRKNFRNRKMLKLQTKQSKAKSKTPQQNREGMHGHTISYITLTSNSLVLGGTKGPQQWSSATHTTSLFLILFTFIPFQLSFIFTRIHYHSNILTSTTFRFIQTLHYNS